MSQKDFIVLMFYGRKVGRVFMIATNEFVALKLGKHYAEEYIGRSIPDFACLEDLSYWLWEEWEIEIIMRKSPVFDVGNSIDVLHCQELPCTKS